MNTIAKIVNFFNKAVPNPTSKNFNTQLGCDMEETAEMLQSLRGHNMETDEALKHFTHQVIEFANKLKTGEIKVEVENRVDFLDAICDKTVTAVGLAVYQKMDVENGLDEVAESNNSKFDLDGNPIFDQNMKIIKGPNYFKANLEQYV